MPREIPLTKGYVAIVDDEDSEEVSKYNWHAVVAPRSVCAKATIQSGGRKYSLYLRRMVMGVTDPSLEVSHINHNGLDNRRENLRILPTGSRSHVNRRSANSASKYLGVSRYKRGGKWVAQIRFGKWPHGQTTNLGYFSSEEAAARAYDVAACDIFGSSANLNFGEYV